MLTEILYEDNDIMIVYKPAGLAVQTGRVGQQDVVSELKNYLAHRNSAESSGKKSPYLGVIHRLDQPVEGVVIFAKNKEAASYLSRQLGGQREEGVFCKHYYAVLCGRPETEEGQLTDYLYKNQENKAVIVGTASGGQYAARRAVLRYHILELLEAQGLALADICIETGRFHQIRAQMAHAGMPLLGDMKYGNEKTKQIAWTLGIRNVALCAYKLEYIHQITKKKIQITVKPRNEAFSFFSQL